VKPVEPFEHNVTTISLPIRARTGRATNERPDESAAAAKWSQVTATGLPGAANVRMARETVHEAFVPPVHGWLYVKRTDVAPVPSTEKLNVSVPAAPGIATRGPAEVWETRCRREWSYAGGSQRKPVDPFEQRDTTRVPPVRTVALRATEIDPAAVGVAELNASQPTPSRIESSGVTVADLPCADAAAKSALPVKRAWMPIQARTRVENRTVPSVATLRVVAACQSPARFFVQIWTACPASRGRWSRDT
jgi:hypothetical protein